MMKLRPSRPQEPVTIIMIPFDQYSSFPLAVRTVLSETHRPFELIIVEGNAPEAIRHKLEELAKGRKNVKIIYSDHRPRMAQAFNLGLAHARTQHIFLMHNSLRVTPGWLDPLMEMARSHHGIICPYISYADGPARHIGLEYPVTFSQGRVKEPFEVDMHGFLMNRDLLDRLGPFDESVSTPLVGVDLGLALKKLGLSVCRDPYTVLEYRSHGPLKGPDLRLFKWQWDIQHTHESIAYLSHKHGVMIDQKRHLDWLNRKIASSSEPPKARIQKPEDAIPRILSPKLSFDKFISVIHRA